MSSSFTGNLYENSEKNKQLVQRLSKLPQNRECADCDAKSPGWASWNLGIFICIKCAGIHRKMGTHISQVRSATLDKWAQHQAENMEKVGGNIKANQYYERNKPSSVRRPSESDDVVTKEKFIRSKYEKKLWIEKGSDIFGDNSQGGSNAQNASSSASSSSQSNSPSSLSTPSRSSGGSFTQTTSTSIRASVSTSSQKVSQSGPSLLDFESTPEPKQTPEQKNTSSSVQQPPRTPQNSVQNQNFTPSSAPQPQNTNAHPTVQSDFLINETKERSKSNESIMNLFDSQSSTVQPVMYGQPNLFPPRGNPQQPFYQPPMVSQGRMQAPPMMGGPVYGRMQAPPMMGGPVHGPMMGGPMMGGQMNHHPMYQQQMMGGGIPHQVAMGGQMNHYAQYNQPFQR